jgi:glycerol-3-phosphate dehydrogenase
LEFVPELAAEGLTGGVLFHDAQMYNSERVVLEVLQAAVGAGAVVANYAEFTAPLHVRGSIAGARATDLLCEENFEVHAKVIINAAGGEVGAVAEALAGRVRSELGGHTAALNVMVPSRGHTVSFAIGGAARDPDAKLRLGGRQLFFVPWRGRWVIGTGYFPFDGDPTRFAVRESDVARFLEEVNGSWPGSTFELSDVVLAHGGLIPVEASSAGVGVRFLKRHRILDHSTQGTPNILTAITGKFTTARRAAEDVVDRVGRKLGLGLPTGRTAQTPLPGAVADSSEALAADARERFGHVADGDVIDHLVRTYGSDYESVLSYRHTVRDWDLRPVDQAPVIKAQFVHAIREEMAQRADDLIWRRTEVGARGMDSQPARRLASETLAEELRSGS